MFAVDAVKDIFACVCIYFYCCFRTTKVTTSFLSFSSLPLQTTLFRPFFFGLFFFLLLLVQKFSLSLSFDVRLLLLQKRRRRRRKMKQTTTATVLADNTANVPTTLVSYLQRLKALDETSASVSDKVHSEVETFVLRALETTKTNQTTGKDDNNNNNNNNNNNRR